MSGSAGGRNGERIGAVHTRSRSAPVAPSPRVRGEGRDEGALPPGSDLLTRPLTRIAPQSDLSPRSGERKEIESRSRGASSHPSYATPRARDPLNGHHRA